MDKEKDLTLDNPNTESINKNNQKLKDKILSNTDYKPYVKCFTYILGVLIIFGLLYVMYNSFYEKQLKEPFIEKTIRSDPADDVAFDKFNVMDEVCSLRKKQEDYLIKLNQERSF